MDITRREKIGLSVFLIIMLFLTSVLYFNNRNKNEIIVNSKKEAEGEVKKNDSLIKVYIYGEIKNPGVYTLKNGDRIEELIKAAGGFSENAELSQINLAGKLKDEDFIKIPSKNILNTQIQGSGGNINIKSDKININIADKESLKELPRIGDALAQRIVDYREKNGSFKDIKEIMNVSGIGEKMFENIKDKITVH